MKSIKDFKVKGKTVLVRCDFNVPIDSEGQVLDDFRIKKTLPTIQYLQSQKAKVVLMSHLAEPKGKPEPTLTLDKVKTVLEKLLGASVQKVDDCVGEKVTQQVKNLKEGEILLLENLRFHQEETQNNLVFAEQLAHLGDIYINDAFGDCHRVDASMVSVPKYLPHGAGLLLEQEVTNLSKVLQKPKKPLVAIVGGAKVTTKASFIEKISEIADTVLVSGLIRQEITKENLQFTEAGKIISPTENLGAPDIDEKTIELFTNTILGAKTIVWNGPLGKFEDEQYKKGTLAIANAIAQSKAFSVAGGGETIEFLHKEGMIDQFSHVSTGGGAMLEFLSGQKLPGLQALEYYGKKD